MSTSEAAQSKTGVDLDQLCINTIRTLSMDAVQQAKSGHPGPPLSFSTAISVTVHRTGRTLPRRTASRLAMKKFASPSAAMDGLRTRSSSSPTASMIISPRGSARGAERPARNGKSFLENSALSRPEWLRRRKSC